MTILNVYALIFDKDRRILVIRRQDAPLSWTIPGDKLGDGESPIEGLVRIAYEAAQVKVRPTHLIGVYATTFNDNLILSIEAEATEPDEEPKPGQDVADAGFFTAGNLPYPLHYVTRAMINDAFEGKTGVIRVFSHPEPNEKNRGPEE